MTADAGGVDGALSPELLSSIWCFAISMAAAVSWASLGAIMCLGGTTTDGPVARSSRVAVIEERRRMPGLAELDGATRLVAIFAIRRMRSSEMDKESERLWVCDSQTCKKGS